MRNPSSVSSPSSAATGGTKTPCCTKVGLKRGPWTPEEDELLSAYIKREGEGRWRTLPHRAGLLRCGKSCRLRWMNYLRPSVKRGHIAPDEEDLILRLHRLLGNRWSLIAGRIPGRTDNEIKNYWNTHLSKKLISQGIDPRTHKPLNPDSSAEDRKPSSSRANSMSNPNPNPDSPVNLVTHHHHHHNLEQTGDGTATGCPIAADMIKGNGTFDGEDGTSYNSLVNFRMFHEGTETGLGGGRHGLSNEEEDDNDINYGSDEVFSSFLNSLINEDDFNTQLQGQQLIQPNGVLPANTYDPLICPPQASIFGAGWEAPIMCSESVIKHCMHAHVPWAKGALIFSLYIPFFSCLLAQLCIH